MSQLLPSNAAIIDNSENFVDANTSNIDVHPGHGTSSNFTAQQDANVAFNDTLTEADTGGAPLTITFVSVSAEATGTGAVTPALPASMVSGDICILVATTIVAGTVTITASGSITTWTALTGSPIDVALGEKLYVWWGRWTSGTTGPTVTPGSDHIEAGIGAWRNCIGNGSPIDVSQTGTETTSDTTFSFVTSISTTVNGAMAIAVCTTGQDIATDGRFTTMTDASLASLAERMDYCTSSGGGGGFALDQGYKATAGAVGTWASTLLVASSKAYISFALKPALVANYELDYEFSWTTADFDEANEYLCIRTSSFTGTAENLGVDVWDGTWKSISNALTASQWNNISISTNLTGATIYFRFIGKTEASDSAQNTWVIECNLIHTWSTDYPLALGTTATMTLSTIVQVNYHVAINQSTSFGLTLNVSTATEEIVPVDLGVTTQVSFNTVVQVNYHVTTTEATTTTLTLNGQAQESISSNVTGTITLTTLVQVVHGIQENLTGTVTFMTSVQVAYHVSMDETNSLLLDLIGESELEIPSNVTGVVTFNVLVETSYHIELSENNSLNMDMSVGGNLSLHQIGNGTITLNTLVQVAYHVTTSETQTFTISHPESTNYSKSLSLIPNIMLGISISGNFSSPLSASPSWPSTSPSWPEGTPMPGSTIGNVFDVRVVRIAYVYRFEQFALTRSVGATLNMTNAGTTSGDAVVDWWVVDTAQTKIVARSETGFVGAGESKLLVCTFDLEQGDYVFNAEVKSIAGYPLSSRAVATLAFSVGYIYTDFITDNFIPILIIGSIVIICAQSYRLRKRKRSQRRHKRKRRS